MGGSQAEYSEKRTINLIMLSSETAKLFWRVRLSSIFFYFMESVFPTLTNEEQGQSIVVGHVPSECATKKLKVAFLHFGRVAALWRGDG